MSKYGSWQCQKCGENIGWVGRFILPFFHTCIKKRLPHVKLGVYVPESNKNKKPMNHKQIKDEVSRVFKSVRDTCHDYPKVHRLKAKDDE